METQEKSAQLFHLVHAKGEILIREKYHIYRLDDGVSLDISYRVDCNDGSFEITRKEMDEEFNVDTGEWVDIDRPYYFFNGENYESPDFEIDKALDLLKD